MSDEVPQLTGRLRTVAIVAVGLVVVAGVVLRFLTHSGLWLDEALTVDRARLPISAIAGSVRHDGAPPLYYYLLHFWMRLFGQSDLATRSLSGVIGVLTLPVAWLAGNRYGGRTVAWVTLVLLASAPFAVYYSTEARMYALVILLTGCGFLALHRALAAPKPGNLVALAVVTGALLYTQYWALYLVAMAGLWLLGLAWWSHHKAPDGEDWKQPVPAFLAVVVGCLTFVPWIPSFLYQSAHTGTPWAAPPNFAAVINAVTGFTANQGSLSSVGTDQGRLLALVYFGMFALALFGIGRTRRIIELDLKTRSEARGLSFTVVGTLFAAIAGGILTTSAFSPRYASVVFLPLLMLVALGTTTLLDPRVRYFFVAVAVVAGMIGAFQNINTQRTQATKVAAVINVQARPGDIIAYCPDQLGPSVYRVTAHNAHYKETTFPRGTGPALVDWVDYAKTVHHASPTAFAATLVADAGTTHHIWLAWDPGYQTYGIKCDTLASALLNTPKLGGRNWVTNSPKHYYEPMNLTEFAPEK
ncbi:MAG TPA: glycosyltransferase family 39 protein [Acidimicrobiales bacterium]|jgi:4-amino-4-deoxy-L-arabinose transferase-like glycosyltransferase|nr:glycosyltransferase family 39 protein [Acidimicrobiales bacterium]